MSVLEGVWVCFCWVQPYLGLRDCGVLRAPKSQTQAFFLWTLAGHRGLRGRLDPDWMQCSPWGIHHSGGLCRGQHVCGKNS